MRSEHITKPGILLLALLASCGTGKKQEAKDMTANAFSGAPGEVRLMTLDPGHFHAALILKTSYGTMNDTVHVYAPDGPDVLDHLARVEGFNSRETDPTSWTLQTYRGPDFFEKMLAEKPGNLMNVSGNNQRKTGYILETVRAGIHVLADKPMAISPEDFTLLEEAFSVAGEQGVLLYDIMTERYEITTILQRELSMIPEVFGELTAGTPKEPAITKESVHHLFKYVAGNPLKRPAWFFDTRQQGEGIVDVNTHLVDLIQWEAFPEQILKKEDVEIVSAKRWTTDLSPEMFKKVTHLDRYPEYLEDFVEGDSLKIYCNGEIVYRLKGIHAKASVAWNFMAPEGAGDTHYSIMRGSKCRLIIRQGEKENYKPVLYIEAASEDFSGEALVEAISKLEGKYPGIKLLKPGDERWALDIPDKYKVGHEAHFGQVTEKFLGFLQDGKLPDWEVPNMIVKYYTTTEGLRLAQKASVTAR